MSGGNIKRLWGFMSRNRGAMLASLFTSMSGSFFAVLATLYVGKTIDAAIGKGNVNFPTLAQSLAMLLAAYLLSSVLTWIGAMTANRVAFRTALELRKTSFQKLGRLPLSYFDSTPHGDMISRLTVDCDNVGDALYIGLGSLLTGIVTVAASLIFMLVLDGTLALVAIVTIPLCFFAAWLIAKICQRTFEKQQRTVGELASLVNETVGSQKIVIALGQEQKSVESFRKINAVLNKAGTDAQFASAMLNPSTRLIEHLTYLLVGVVGALAVINGRISVGIVSSFLIYAAQFSKPFNEISGIMVNIQTAFASLSRIFALHDQNEEIPDAPTAYEMGDIVGNVNFEDVSFSYSKKRKLIENLDFRAPPGAVVAIVGPTGAGKTTIVNLLMRFYELDGGAISVDGHDITEIQRDSLRRCYGMVLQDTWLFSGTIRDNIAFGSENVSDQDVVNAAKAAFAHTFIKQTKHGYDTVITEDGGNLSQGQKQLLTISRVMLQNPPMLILDEATSSIDTLTEQRVQSAFLRLMKGRTSFVIAHRLSTIVSADIILVLDAGKIVETGTHKQLMERRGFYHRLYSSQFSS